MFGAIASNILRNAPIAGPLEGGTHIGTCGEPGEGAYVRIWLQIEDGRIRRASYTTHGCPSSQAASGATVTLATGRTLEEASRITAKDIDTVLGGLPEGKGQFADMAVSALRRAMGLEP